MKLYDQHLHSLHSFDSKTEPRENVEAAIAKGLGGLTFTEHFDTHPDDWPECIYNEEAISESIARLRDEFGKRIFIGKGIEVCFQPTRMDFILDFLSIHRFDAVLLSVHWFDGMPGHKRATWENRDVNVGTRLYLEEVLRAVRFVEELHAKRGPIFDVLTHMDFVKRYTKRYLGTFDVLRHLDLFEEILRGCLRANLVPEVNTSTLRQGLGETMPNADVVRMYAALGGSAMPLGSDAHRPEDIGAGFTEAGKMLREAGIGQTLMFRGRERVESPLFVG